VALIIYIRLTQYDIDAAEKELNGTKSWAQDTLLQQLAEVFPSLDSYLQTGLGESSKRRRFSSRSILHL
jgi:hypothetical protein